MPERRRRDLQFACYEDEHLRRSFDIRKIKMLSLALGLSVLALHANRSGATTTCEQQCYAGQQQCQITCSKHPCLISCADQLQFCLNGCGSSAS
jgi:hypothetical protein